MSDSVYGDRSECGICQSDLVGAFCGGVSFISCLNIREKDLFDLRKTVKDPVTVILGFIFGLSDKR